MSQRVTVTCEAFGLDDDPDVIVVRIDGAEVGAYCIADDPEAERQSMERMVRLVQAAAVPKRTEGIPKDPVLGQLARVKLHDPDWRERPVRSLSFGQLADIIGLYQQWLWGAESSLETLLGSIGATHLDEALDVVARLRERGPSAGRTIQPDGITMEAAGVEVSADPRKPGETGLNASGAAAEAPPEVPRMQGVQAKCGSRPAESEGS